MMSNHIDGREFQARLQRLDRMLQGAERLADPTARTLTREVVQAVLDLHGVGLERLLALLREGREAGAGIIDACLRDEVVAGLLLLHDLHPQSLEERVRQALEQVRPYLQSHGGNVELLGVQDGVVRLRLDGSCKGCPSSAVTMTQTIEEAIIAKAPDATAVEVEGVVQTPQTTPDGRPLVVLTVA